MDSIPRPFMLTPSDGALEEVQYVHGNKVNESWLLHHFQFDSFCPLFGLDDFAMPTARPDRFSKKTNNFAHDIQRAFYSDYLRQHKLKAQVVYLSLGIIGSVIISELQQNDNGVQNISGLNDYLLQLLQGVSIWGMFPALYCDGLYSVLATILHRFWNPTPELQLLNMRMPSLRECIEHVLADHCNSFQSFSVPRYLHLFNSWVKIRQLCLVSFFTSNCFLLSWWHKVKIFWTNSSNRDYSSNINLV